MGGDHVYSGWWCNRFILSLVDFGSLSLEIPEVIFENQEITFNCSGGVTNGSYRWSLNGSILSGHTNEQLTTTVPLSWMGSCLTCHVQSQGEVTNVSRSLTVLGKWDI